MKGQTIVFDCDGVVLDSNAVKVEAFRHALAGEPKDAVEALLEEHRHSGGVSRYEKLDRYFAAHPEEPGGAGHQTRLNQALARFTEFARAQLTSCPMVPGAEALLAGLRAGGQRSYLVSGGDQVELEQVFAARELTQYFEQICGSPTTKDKHLSKLRDAGLLDAGGWFVGDARLDMEVAEAFGLDFAFVAGHTDWQGGREEARARGHLVVENLEDAALRRCLGSA